MNRLETTTQEHDKVNASRRLVIMAGAAMLVGLGSSAASAATLGEIKKQGVMNVVTEDDFYPFELIKDGKPDGFHKDVINEVGVQAGGAQLARLSQLDAKLQALGGKLGKVVQYQSYPEVYTDDPFRRTEAARGNCPGTGNEPRGHPVRRTDLRTRS